MIWDKMWVSSCRTTQQNNDKIKLGDKMTQQMCDAINARQQQTSRRITTFSIIWFDWTWRKWSNNNNNWWLRSSFQLSYLLLLLILTKWNAHTKCLSHSHVTLLTTIFTRMPVVPCHSHFLSRERFDREMEKLREDEKRAMKG